jgi:hypothetical protein
LQSYATLPFVLDYLAVWPYSNPDTLERAAHALCESTRLSFNGAITEWFALSPEQLQQLEAFLLCHGIRHSEISGGKAA